MKRTIIAMLLIMISPALWACPVCEKQQTGIFGGLTHGGGPQSNWEYLITIVMGVIVIATLYFSVKWLIRPGETSESHIKRIVLNPE